MTLATTASFATVCRTMGLTLFAIVLVATIVYVLVNVVFSGKAELGAEIELAANRKPYYDDEALEGPRLDRALTLGLLTLFVLAIGIPLYWIMEPARQANAADGFNNKFIHRGEAMFAPTGDNAQALNCAGCHGGVNGGTRHDFVLTTPNPEFDADEPESDDNPGQPHRGRRLAGPGAEHACCCGSAGRSSRSSSPTADRARRCRRGASTAVVRSTPSRCRT